MSVIGIRPTSGAPVILLIGGFKFAASRKRGRTACIDSRFGGDGVHCNENSIEMRSMELESQYSLGR